ncbi:MAG: hypothetical protein V1705_02505 [bacterium]
MEEAFGLRIETAGMKTGDTRQTPGLNWCEILMGGDRPKNIAIKVSLRDSNGNGKTHIVSFGRYGESSAEQNEFQEELLSGKPFVFNVPVAWSNEGVPTTRVEPWDNFRVITLAVDGHFWQTEIGLATRGRKIFLTVQDQWTGWVTKKFDFVPSQSKHNWPGAPTYADLWSGLAPKVEKRLYEMRADLSIQRFAPKWNPGPPPTPIPGWLERGVVLYFSPVAGHGRVLSENGEIRFLHWKALNQNDGVGVSPMTWLHAKIRKTNPGQRYAPILSCKIA